MNTRGLLDQLLKSGAGLLDGKGAPQGPAHASPASSSSSSASASPLSSVLSGAGGGALAAGALGLLVGSKKGRKVGGKVLTYGGVAALGVVAYKAYSNWQRNQDGGAVHPEPRTVDRLPEAEAEQHGLAILRAVIGAAKADGHIDDRERELIDAEVARLDQDPAMQRWFDQELRKPLDPADVAAAATAPEIAAEMYLASALVIDDQSFMERAYLDELVRRMELDPALVKELDAQVRQT